MEPLPHSPVFLMVALLAAVAAAYAAWRIFRKRAGAGPQGEAEGPLFTRLKTEIAEVDGWKIRYHQSGKARGEGPDIVMLHGISASLYIWRSLIERLRPFARLTAYDLHGFGMSSKNRGVKYGLDEQVERLEKFLDHLEIRKCYLVGNSMGANIALAFALKNPERTLGVAALAPATSPGLVRVAFASAPWLWLAGPASLLVNRRLVRRLHAQSVSRQDLILDGRIEDSFKTYGRSADAIRSLLLATTAIRDQRLPSVFKDVKTRVLILWGSRDTLVKEKDIKALEAVLPAHESYIHIGGGHHIQEDEPDWTADKILAFFPIEKS